MIRGLKSRAVRRWLEFAKPKVAEGTDIVHSKQCLEDCIKFCPVRKQTKLNGKTLQLQANILNAANLNPFDMPENLTEDTGISRDANELYFHVAPEVLAEAVMTDIVSDSDDYGRRQASEAKNYFDGRKFIVIPRNENLVVDYSSPNIAKTFHAGHLRSTVIGRFVVNVCRLIGQNVTSVNYLGDWGTQFGYVALGYEKYGSLEAFNSKPMQHLFDVYVKINEDGEKDATIHSEAKLFFQKLENGDVRAREFWSRCRDVSIAGYKKMYQRLGVTFDVTTGESTYSDGARRLAESLRDRNLILVNDSGVQYMDITEEGDKSPMSASLLKSDGSTLYLTRDVASALDRCSTFAADKLLYVVENGQQRHFESLKRILRRLKVGGINDDLHVKFGRVEKMSTRRGEVVLLSDILDEAHLLMKERMMDKRTTKVRDEELDEVAEKLGVCGIVVQDLKQSRLNNYAFSWEEMLNFNGDTGIFLQYTHARIHSLIENSKQPQHSVDYKLISEDCALMLLQHLARFDEVLLKSYMELEACHLVQYLFTLGRLVNMAHRQLIVKDQPTDIANVRRFNISKPSSMFHPTLAFIPII